MTTIAEVLEFAEVNEVLTQENISIILGSVLSECSAEKLAGLNAIDLAKELIKAQCFTNNKPLAKVIAQSLLAEFKQNSINPEAISTPNQPQQQSIQFPSELRLIQDKPNELKDIEELLVELMSNPSNLSLMRAFLNKDEVKKALRKTQEIAIVNGSLDVKQTVAYINHLNTALGTTRNRFGGKRTVTIEEAIGAVSKVIIHPLVDNEVIGADNRDHLDLDWSNVPRNTIKSVIWAKRTNHPALRGYTFDVFQGLIELQTSPLNPRWQRIVEDFEAAQQKEDSSTLFSIYKKNSVLNDSAEQAASEILNVINAAERGIGITGTSIPLSNESQCEKIVRDYLDDDKQEFRDYCKVKGVYNNLSVIGDYNDLTVIVLGVYTETGDYNDGIVYRAPGSKVSQSGDYSNVRVVRKSWQELAELVKSLN